MSITYRNFEKKDVPCVLAMWSSCEGVRLHSNGEDSEEGIIQCLERNEKLSFLAEEEGKIVGAVLNGQDGRRGYIYHLIVADSYRKQGIAAHLLQLTQDSMISVGIHKMALFVVNENETAKRVYRALGWTEVTEAKTFAKVMETEGLTE